MSARAPRSWSFKTGRKGTQVAVETMGMNSLLIVASDRPTICGMCKSKLEPPNAAFESYWRNGGRAR